MNQLMADNKVIIYGDVNIRPLLNILPKVYTSWYFHLTLRHFWKKLSIWRT